MTHIEKRTAHKSKECALPVRRAWYEYAGAEVMAISFGVWLGAILTRTIGARRTTIVGAIGFVLACASVWLAALAYRVRFERARANVSRGTLQKLRGAAPTTPAVPPEHRRER